MIARLSRRRAVGWFGAALVAAASRRATGADSSAKRPSLKALAAMKGMRFGSAVSDHRTGSFNDPNYARLLDADCALLVAENELKWQAIRPAPDRFDFDAFDRILAQANARGMAMRGHNLLWHRPKWLPKWLEQHEFGPAPAAEAERILTTHIRTVCRRYRGQIHGYDVVNETVLPEDGTLAQTVLSRAIGGTEPLLDLAFHVAREEAGGSQLVYNDYMSWEPGNEKHRDGVLRLLEGFRRRGTPVDALGVQSHLRPAGPPQEAAWRRFIDDVLGMGYGILVTEFDVNDQDLPADPVARDQAVADAGRAYLELMFSYRQLKDVLVWGMCDSASWLQGFKPLRIDGRAKRPCLYDAAFQPKPLWDAVARSFAAAPART